MDRAVVPVNETGQSEHFPTWPSEAVKLQDRARIYAYNKPRLNNKCCDTLAGNYPRRACRKPKARLDYNRHATGDVSRTPSPVLHPYQIVRYNPQGLQGCPNNEIPLRSHAPPRPRPNGTSLLMSTSSRRWSSPLLQPPPLFAAHFELRLP